MNSARATFCTGGAADCAPEGWVNIEIVAAQMSAFSQVDIPALWCLNGTSMKSKVVAILETRTGAHLAELVARRGGVPMLAPALQEVPVIDAQAMRSLLTRWQADPFKI